MPQRAHTPRRKAWTASGHVGRCHWPAYRAALPQATMGERQRRLVLPADQGEVAGCGGACSWTCVLLWGGETGTWRTKMRLPAQQGRFWAGAQEQHPIPSRRTSLVLWRWCTNDSRACTATNWAVPAHAPTCEQTRACPHPAPRPMHAAFRLKVQGLKSFRSAAFGTWRTPQARRPKRLGAHCCKWEEGSSSSSAEEEQEEQQQQRPSDGRQLAPLVLGHHHLELLDEARHRRLPAGGAVTALVREAEAARGRRAAMGSRRRRQRARQAAALT